MAKKIPKMPTLEQIQALVSRQGGKICDAYDLLLILKLMHVGDYAHHEILDSLDKNHGISEGRFLLLVSLREAGTLKITDLAQKLGVSAASASVMISRMLKDKEPLIVRHSNQEGGYSFVVSLSPKGEELVDRLISLHLKRVHDLISPLALEERKCLFELLSKLSK